MDDKAIIVRINALFRKSGLTQSEAAEKIGISRNAFCNILYGKTKNFYKHLPALAGLFGVPEESLTAPDGGAASARLRETADWEEARRELVRVYEDKIAELQSIIKEKDEHISALRKLCSMQERLLGQND